MADAKNNWYVITGGPSSGKTTLLAELEKLGHKVVPEAARKVIDEALAKGQTVEELRADELHFQEIVARMKEKTEAALNADVVTFFDRGMHDTVAYLKHYGFNMEKWLSDLMSNTNYRKVFLLDPLPNFQKDYARTEKLGFAQQIHELLHEAYSEFGMEPTRVPVASSKKRAKFILNNLETDQKA